jgi:hypothetical protein
MGPKILFLPPHHKLSTQGQVEASSLLETSSLEPYWFRWQSPVTTHPAQASTVMSAQYCPDPGLARHKSVNSLGRPSVLIGKRGCVKPPEGASWKYGFTPTPARVQGQPLLPPSPSQGWGCRGICPLPSGSSVTREPRLECPESTAPSPSTNWSPSTHKTQISLKRHSR